MSYILTNVYGDFSALTVITYCTMLNFWGAWSSQFCRYVI